jgi:hypothetical protein
MARTKKKQYSDTAEAERGRRFLEQLRFWKMLHFDGGSTVFNKEILAKRFFGINVAREKHKRYVQRLINILVTAGMVSETDKDGKPVTKDQIKAMFKKNRFSERWWRYTVSGEES